MPIATLFHRLALGLMVTVGLGASGAAQTPGGSTADWAGPYVGIHAGRATSESDWTYDNANYFNTLGPAVIGNDFSLDPDGAVGGVHVGFNHQMGSWVVGLEGSAALADVSERRPSPFFPTLDTYHSEIDWLASVTGRAGYAWPSWLTYVKAGWAGADVDLALFDFVSLIEAKTSRWANGWTVGAGAEYRLSRQVSLGVEYDYLNLGLGNKTVSCPACGTGIGFGTPVVDGDIEVHSVTARLNYLIGQ